MASAVRSCDGASSRKWRRVLLGASLAIALVAGALAEEAAPPEPAAAPAEPETYRGRGVYYVEGKIASPVGSIGARSPRATNRLVLDDEHSVAVVDRALHRIVIRNEHRYGVAELNELVGCLLLLGSGTTESGDEVPVAVHLKIHKTGNRFHTTLHPHPTVRERLVSAVFEPFDVVLDNGESRRVVLTPQGAVEAVRDPQLTARLANVFMQVTDNLEGVTLAPEQAGTPLVDLSLAFGTEKLNVNLARVRLLSNSAKNAELLREGSVARLLKEGDWEFRVDSSSPYIPRSEFDRDFFLFGIEGLPAIQQIARRGLLRGETLVVGLRDGRGYIGVGDARSEIPHPADVARSYLEFHFVGGVVARQVSQLPRRLP